MIRKNPNGDHPDIDDTAYIDPSAVIIGKVKIGNNVFVGPAAVIRADELDSSIIIADNCNIQDRVVMHSLEDSLVLTGENTSLAHGCIIHGPCKIGNNCFIGLGSVIFNSEIGEGAAIMHLAVLEGVSILPGKVVGSSRSLSSLDDVAKLEQVDQKLKDFTRKVITRKMTPTPKYQQRQSCNERVYNCKGTQCIHSNSKCARQKIREHVDEMAESMQECIRIEQRNETLQ